MLILTFDLGTTWLKTALFSYSSQQTHPELFLLANLSTNVSYQRQEGILLEIDPFDFWATTLDAIGQVCGKASVVPGDIDRISITSQAQTFCLLDQAKNPITPFISWADRRASDQAQRLSVVLGHNHHQHCSFPKPVAEIASSKHLWLTENEKAIHNAASWSMPLPSWLGMKLGALPFTDRNLAAMSGLYSLKLRSWWPDSLAACGFQSVQFPRLVNPGVPVSIHNPQPVTKLRPGATIVMAGNDQTCGALSSQIQPGETLVTLGSALVAYTVIRGDTGPFSPDACWGEFPGGAYYQLATLSDGTIALDWAVSQFKVDDRFSFQSGNIAHNLTLETFSERAQLQYKKNQFDLPLDLTEVFFYPELSRESVPHFQPAQSHPAFWGSGGAGDYFLSVFEGICFALKALFQTLFPNTRPNRVLLAGGGSQNVFWVQLIANVLGQMVSVVTSSPSIGAAIIAAVGETKESIFINRNQETHFLPQLDQVKVYSEKYKRWLSHRIKP